MDFHTGSNAVYDADDSATQVIRLDAKQHKYVLRSRRSGFHVGLEASTRLADDEGAGRHQPPTRYTKPDLQVDAPKGKTDKNNVVTRSGQSRSLGFHVESSRCKCLGR